MTQNINLADSSTDTHNAPPVGIDHVTVDVEYPDGTTESVDPEYETFITADPNEFYPDDIETGVTRLDIEHAGTVDAETVIERIEEGFTRFVADGGSVDGLIEKVYTRTVGDDTSLCLVVRSPVEEKESRSQFALCLYEALCDEYADE